MHGCMRCGGRTLPSYSPVSHTHPRVPALAGESLQTHCYFNTALYSASPEVTFSTPTSSEMCQDFLFYYPKQLRNNEAFAFCGVASFTSEGNTICGSLSQGPSLFALPVSTQKQRGNASYIDPTFFGQANSAQLAPESVAACSPSPPAPSSPPVSSDFAVEVAFTAAGDPSDYDGDATRSAILDTLATLAGLTPPVAGATLTVTAASVNFLASFPVASQAAADSAQSALATNAPDQSSLQTSLTSAGLSITVTSAATAAVISSANDSPLVVIICACLGGVILGACLFFLFLRRRTSATDKGKAVHA